MKIDKILADDYVILSLKGEFDTFYCPRFQEEVEGVLERGINHVILNMRMVKFVNSTALGAVIKAYKRCKAEGGELLIGQPSTFVKKVISQLGIDQLVPMFDSEEEAVKSVVQSLNQRELAGDAPVDEEKVLITFPDSTRNKQIGGKKALVGTMCNVDGQRVQFLWNGKRQGFDKSQSAQLFYVGGDIGLKFQVKLFKKGFFEVVGKVTESKPAEGDDVRITATYKDIPDSDREALDQFAADMEFLKRQIKS
jgi:anti-anti-sigma factor